MKIENVKVKTINDGHISNITCFKSERERERIKKERKTERKKEGKREKQKETRK